MSKIAARNLAALTATALAAAALASCSADQGGRPPCPSGERCLNVTLSSAPYRLDPQKAFMQLESDLMHNLFVGLTSWDRTGRTVPGMATAWSTSADGLTWTFRLRDANWSDGAPFTAEDFVFTFRRALDPKTAAPYVTPLMVIKGGHDIAAGKAPPSTLGVYAPDARTVVIELDHPVANLADIMAYMAALPSPKHVVEKWGDAWIKPEHFVGNGAYTLASFDADGGTVMRENRRYFEPGRRCFSEVRNFVTTDMITAERRVASGEMDIANRFKGTRITYLRREMPDFVRTGHLAAPNWIAFNLRVPALRDIRVRQAMAMAIDSDFITRSLTKAVEVPIYSYTPSNLPGYVAPQVPWKDWTFDRRISVARDLMRQVGYSAGKPLRLDFGLSGGNDRRLAAVLQADWRSIGVEITVNSQESAVYYNDMRIHKFEVGLTGWVTDFLEPGTFLDLLKKGDEANYASYDNPHVEAMVDAANRQPDAKRRLAMMRQAEEIVLRDLPVAPAWLESERFLVNPRITGFYNNPLGSHRYEFLCEK